jgi:hypothetical protein
MCHPTVIRLLVLVRGCSVIPELGWIPGDWGGIIPSQACGGLDPSQSTSNLLLTGINKQTLIWKAWIYIYFKSSSPYNSDSTFDCLIEHWSLIVNLLV